MGSFQRGAKNAVNCLSQMAVRCEKCEKCQVRKMPTAFFALKWQFSHSLWKLSQTILGNYRRHSYATILDYLRQLS